MFQIYWSVSVPKIIKTELRLTKLLQKWNGAVFDSLSMYYTPERLTLDPHCLRQRCTPKTYFLAIYDLWSYYQRVLRDCVNSETSTQRQFDLCSNARPSQQQRRSRYMRAKDTCLPRKRTLSTFSLQWSWMQQLRSMKRSMNRIMGSRSQVTHGVS